MPIETDKPDFGPNDLNILWPLEDDDVGGGDDHMRLIKKAVKNLQAQVDNLPGGGGGGHLTGDIRYTALDKDAASVQPPNYLFASGQAVSRVDYSALFDKIGTRFGPGDGTTTFNVPDVNEGFIPADVGIFTPGNSNGLPTDILTSTLRSNPVTGSLILRNLRTKWWHYRQKGSPIWEALPFPDGVNSVSWAVADIIDDDVVVLYYKTTTSTSVMAKRVTWKLGESTSWADGGEYQVKPNESSSPQNLNFEQLAITPDGSLEVMQATGSANIYFHRPAEDGNFFFRSTTTADNNTTGQRIAITKDGKKVLRSASYYISEYTVGASKPWEGSFTPLPRPGSTNATECIEYGEDDAIFAGKRGVIYFFNRVTSTWVEYPNDLNSGTMRSMAYDGTTGQMVIIVINGIYRMSAGAATPRVMGYVKT